MLAPPLILRLQYALTAAAGVLDVFCVTHLGGPFASVVTGNLVQVGSSVDGRDFDLAAGCALAVVGYAVGVAVGAAALRTAPAGWTVRTTRTVLAEFLLIAVVTAVWRVSYGDLGSTAEFAMLGLASLSMGLQSAATVASGLPGATTTYLTGTLTTAIRTMVVVPHGLASGSRPLQRLAALLAGAIAGGLMQRAALGWAPALAAGIIAAVVAIATARQRSAGAASKTGG
jgi:uncharacterized membrane protein YoaK (UPF0700 family)